MPIQEREKAPRFELPRLGAEGTVSLAELLQSGPALLVFVKADCPTCQWALPMVDRIFRNLRGGPASVVVIAQEPEADAARMVEELELQLPVLLDSEPYPVSESYGWNFVPAFVYVDPRGRVENVFESFAREELKEINVKLAGAAGIGEEPFFEAGEGVPGFRPG